MRVFLLALALAAPSAWAETNVCTVISSLPAVISTPGSYCLEQDLSLPAVIGDESGIAILNTTDVTLDCNGHLVSGTELSPEDPALEDTHYIYTGIRIGTSERVTVRNCRVRGFFHGIYAHRASNEQPRSRELRLEGNRIDHSLIGIYFISDGGVVTGNVVTDAKHTAFSSFAPPVSGMTVVEGNVFTRTGNTIRHHVNPYGIYGDPISLELGGGPAWLVFRGNTVSESIAPAGETTPVFAVRYVPAGTGMFIEDNLILAPANPAQKGSATLVFGDNIGPKCRDNVIVGYGSALPAACTDPSNSAY